MIDLEAIRQSTRLVKRLPDELVSQAQRNVIALLEEIDLLRGNLSLAEEGLANYQQENAQLREALLRLSVSAQRLSEEAALALAGGSLPQSAPHAAEPSEIV